MANGDVHDQVSDQYLAQFNKSVGVSGMQKLQQFPELQKLGHAGTLSHLKQDFHGLTDFKSQMAKYSSVSHTLRVAWALISAIAPNNPSIAAKLTSVPGLGSVGKDFLSIHNFGQVFSLSPGDLKTPGAVKSKSDIYKTQSTKTSVVESNPTAQQIGGGAGLSSPGNANQLQGIQITGLPTNTNNTLQFVNGQLVWQPVTGGGGGGPDDDSAYLTIVSASATYLPITTAASIYQTLANLTTNTSLGASNSLYPSQNAVKVYVDTAIASISGNDSAFQLLSNLSTNTSLGTSNTLYPSQNAVKAYVDASVSAEVDALSGLTDVTITSLISSQFLQYNGTKWVNHTLASADLSDAASLEYTAHKDAISGYAGLDASTLLKAAEFPAFTGDVSKVSGSLATTVVAIQGFSIATSTPASGQALIWNSGSSKWTATDLSAVASANAAFDQNIPIDSSLPTDGQGLIAEVSGTISSVSTNGSDVTTITCTNTLVTGQKVYFINLNGGSNATFLNGASYVVQTAVGASFTINTTGHTSTSATPSTGNAYTLAYQSPVPQITTAQVVATSLAAAAINTTSNLTLSQNWKSILLIKVDTGGKKARVRLYNTTANRTADTSPDRPNSTPPVPGTQHGVLCDLYLDTADKYTWWMSPPALGFNGDSPQVSTIYCAITNLDTSTQTITVTFTFVPENR